MTNNLTAADPKGWSKRESALSDSYWVKDADPTAHVYRVGDRWVRAKVVGGLARNHSRHDTREAAMTALRGE